MARRGAGRRRRQRVGPGRLTGPHQQDRARRVVDDEAGGRPQAARPEAGAVAVAGADEQVGAVSGADDLAFDPAAALKSGGGAFEPASGVVEQLMTTLVRAFTAR